jgi:hypothetical protein
MIFLLILAFTTPQIETHVLEQQFEAHIRFLSNDLMAGRHTGEPGQRITAHYLAAQLRLMQVSGAFTENENPYLQPIDLHTVELLSETSSLESKRRRQVSQLKPYKDFWPIPMGLGDFKASGKLVFAGYGLNEDGYSDVKDLEVKDNWVAILRTSDEVKQGPLKATLEGTPTNLRLRIMVLMTMGAQGVIILTPEEQGAPALGVAQRMTLEREDDPTQIRKVVMVPKHSWAELFGKDFERFEKAYQTLHDEGEPDSFASDQEITVTYDAETKKVPTENVAALIPGVDPDLADEHIVISAHYDHIGVAGEGVYNGADDNGTGTSMMLLLAQVLKDAKPKRSLVFLWVTGEENGLLGSKYYVQKAQEAGTKIVANINMDMLGRNDPYEIGIIPAKVQGISTLRDDLKKHNSKLEKPFTLLKDFDQYNTRSDHYSFLKAEIPALFLFAGLHDDYHAVGDDWHKIEYNKLARLHQLLSGYLLDLANAQQAPSFIDL